MSKIRYHTDEHVSKAVASALRRRGVNVQRTPEIGMLSASDEEHMIRARDEGRVIFTQDDDYLRLATTMEHAGVVYASPDKAIREIISGLMLIYEVLEADEMRNHVEYL
jgi:predicted nuclease of predicted toxin-antitoxin system